MFSKSTNTHRFFELNNFTVNNKFILSQINSHKIINVLRLSLGAIITVFNNTNLEFIAKITDLKINKKNNLIEIIILKAIEKNLESMLKIHLVQAIAKHDNMDLIVQKATELGVNQITPIITERTIVKTNTNQITKKINHWQSIAINACCQCGRNIVPKVNELISFKDFIKNKILNKFILTPNTNFNNIDFNKFNFNPELNQEICIIIGPEGGFNEQELSLATENECLALSLGPRILRTETASIACISILQAQYGDLKMCFLC